jgi:hypothetical protein
MSLDSSTAKPSLVRTGIKAGAAFASSVFQGAVLALLLGAGGFFYYLSRLDGPGMPAARAGGAGAIVALLASPSVLIGVVLVFFVPLYMMVGVAHGRSRAMQQVMRAHGATLAQRLAGAIAGRIEAMPRAHGALQRTPDWLSVDTLSRQLAPVLGDGRAVRAVIGFVLKRLPLSDMLAQWQQNQEKQGQVEAGAEDPALRALLAQRIGDTLEDAAASSRRPLWIVMGIQAALLAAGTWLTA